MNDNISPHVNITQAYNTIVNGVYCVIYQVQEVELMLL